MTSTKSRTVRVFLSSTFRDFAEERDLLVKKVFPELRRRCRERQVELVDVDLRWGITEEQAQRGEVLPICLAEIDLSRPYFMGFIGDRYGWVPETHQYDLSLLVEQPWLDEHRGGKSVTELEMLHGVLNNPAMAGRAFFYFRNSEYSQSKGGAYLSEGPDYSTKLEALKDRIRTSGFPVVESYPKPEALAEMVKEDLWKVIDEAYPEEDVPDPLTLKRRKHEAYGGSRLGLYLGGKQYFTALDATMGKDPFAPVLITGASGGGKSALIANWSKAYKEKHPETLEIVHYLGSGADAADTVKLVTRLLQEISRITGDELKLESDPQKILDALPEWLARASSYAEREGKELLILLDGLDKLSSLTDLRWWPGFLPPRVKLVVSCLDGELQDEARKRMEWTTLEVLPLSSSEGVEILQEYLRQFNKTLPPPECALIAAHPLSTSPLFVRILAEEMRVFGQHELLREKLESYLSATTIDGLFTKVLERIEGDYDADSVRDSLSSIWASRAGLTQEELLSISGLVPATWAPIRNALNEALLESSGRIQFAHDFLRHAVEQRYLSTEQLRKQSHIRIAEWFALQEASPRIAEELPWQWEQAGEGDHLKQGLLGADLFREMCLFDQYELLGYWLRGGWDIEKEMNSAWERWCGEGNEEEKLDAMAKHLAEFLSASGIFSDFTESLYRRLLASSDSLYGAEHAEVLKSLNNLAVFLYNKGSFEEAETTHRRVLEGRKKILGTDNTSTLMSMNNLGVMLTDRGEFTEAESILREALAGWIRIRGEDFRRTLMCRANLGRLLSERGDDAEAKIEYRKSLEGFEKTLGRGDRDTIMAVNNMATMLTLPEERDEAERLYRQAIEQYGKLLGPNHAQTLMSVNNLASLLSEGCYDEEAESLYHQALDGYTKALGSNHPYALMTLTNLANLTRQKGDLVAAETLYRRALQGWVSLRGPAHQYTLQVVMSLGSLLSQMGRHAEAATLLTEYASKSKAGLEWLRYNLACYECLSGNSERAKELAREEISSNSDPETCRQEMLEDDDLEKIRDFIESL
jgi:tetratricopeptide (TPR) repeat protein